MSMIILSYPISIALLSMRAEKMESHIFDYESKIRNGEPTDNKICSLYVLEYFLTEQGQNCPKEHCNRQIRKQKFKSRQMERQPSGQTDKLTNRRVAKQTSGQTDKWKNRQTYKWTNIQIDKITYRQTYR